MVVKTRAIVLHTMKYGESQIIVDFLTESMGRLTFMVKLAKSARAKMKKQYFQPFSVLDIIFEHRSNKKMQKLSDVAIAVPITGLALSPYKQAISLFLAEFLTYATRNEQENKPLFQFVYNSLLWLDMSQGNVANFHLVFLMHLTLYLGFSPNMENETQGAYFDLQEGCFTSYVPLHANYLSKEDTIKLKAMVRLQYQTMHLYTMSRQERNYCIEVIEKYYRLHLPNFPELKTLPILRELFA